MDLKFTFLRQIAANAPFLLMTLPFIGAGLTRASAPWGRELARRTALTNALLSCALALLMLAAYRWPLTSTNASGSESPQRAPALQMVSSLAWTNWFADDESPVARVRLTVGVDGVSLWPIALLPFLSFAALLTIPPPDAHRTAHRECRVLLVSGFLVGALAVQDVVLWLVFALFAASGGLVMSTAADESEQRNASLRLSPLCIGGALLVALSLAGVAATMPGVLRLLPQFGPRPPLTWDIPTLARTVRFLTNSQVGMARVWTLDAEVLALPALAGVALLLPVPPMSLLWESSLRRALNSVRVMTAAFLLLPVTLAARFVQPLFFDELAGYSATTYFLIFAVVAAIRALRPSASGDLSFRLLVVKSLVATAAALSTTSPAQAGGVLLILGGIVVATCETILRTEPNSPVGFDGRSHDQRPPQPAIRWLQKAVAAADLVSLWPAIWLIGGGLLMGTSEFPGSVADSTLTLIALTLCGAARVGQPSIVDGANSSNRLLSASVSSIQSAAAPRPSQTRDDFRSPLTPMSIGCVVALMFVLLALSAAPSIFVERMAPSLRQLPS